MQIRNLTREIAASFDRIPKFVPVKKVRVGIVGEIYVKYSPLANNHLEDFLRSAGLRGQRARHHGLHALQGG